MAHRIDHHPDSYSRPLTDLLKEFMSEVSTLIRQEVALARTEMTEKLTIMARASIMLVVAAFVAFLAAGVLTATIVLAINVALPAWLAALIVTVVYLIIAGIFGLVGYKRLQKAGKPVPEQTIETIKEDISWAKHQARSAAT